MRRLRREKVRRTRLIPMLAAVVLVVLGADTGLLVGRSKERMNNATCLWFKLGSFPAHQGDALAMSEATTSLHSHGLIISGTIGNELFGTHEDALAAKRRLEQSHFEDLVILRYAVSDAASCVSGETPAGWPPR